MSIVTERPVRDVASEAPKAPTLRLNGITKSFGSFTAIKDISVSFFADEIHAVIGENGAGKSTLINVAAGVLQANAGTIEIDGKPIPAGDPAHMRDLGLSVAFQHPALLPDLTVFENLQLVRPALSGPSGRAEAGDLIRRVALKHLVPDLDDRVDTLSLAKRHVVEIARALITKPKILFLDEPTEPFQQDDVRTLFDAILELKRAGVAIIYVSHRLHEMMQIADRLSVIRDGELVVTRPARGIAPAEIVTLITGKAIDQVFPPKGAARGDPVLSVDKLTGHGFDAVSFEVRPGEILGLTGVEGQGQRELIRAIAGLDARTGGAIRVDGVTAGRGVAAMRQAGVMFVPDDRHAEGLFPRLSVQRNVGSALLSRIAPFGVLKRDLERTLSAEVSARMNVRAASLATPVASLSGGNQQKVLVGRELAADPKVLLADEPTKGVDIGARSEIYQKLRASSAAGIGVVVASSDGVELEGLCDRVMVFARGKVVRELSGADVNDDTITDANLSATALRNSGAAATATSRVRRLLAGDQFPILILSLLTAAVIVVTSRASEFFLSGLSIQSMLGFFAILSLVSAAQLTVMIAGGIDLSIGPLMGLVVVAASFMLGGDADGAGLGLGCLAILGGCALYGLLQGLMIVGLRLPSITATLGTFVGLQGVALMLRPTPKGQITDALADHFGLQILGIPVQMWLAALLIVLLEVILLKTGYGRRLRAIGSENTYCQRIGINTRRITVSSFVLSATLAGVAGLMLAGQVGMGSATAGTDYTLMSITAVVLGGASVTGGRGSYLATLCGAALVQSTISASSFLQADTALQYCIVGAVTLVAAATFSAMRRRTATG